MIVVNLVSSGNISSTHFFSGKTRDDLGTQSLASSLVSSKFFIPIPHTPHIAMVIMRVI